MVRRLPSFVSPVLIQFTTTSSIEWLCRWFSASKRTTLRIWSSSKNGTWISRLTLTCEGNAAQTSSFGSLSSRKMSPRHSEMRSSRVSSALSSSSMCVSSPDSSITRSSVRSVEPSSSWCSPSPGISRMATRWTRKERAEPLSSTTLMKRSPMSTPMARAMGCVLLSA